MIRKLLPVTGTLCFALALGVVTACWPAWAQESTTAASDGAAALFLELIRMESDRVKKTQLLEQFTKRYPRHDYTSTALGYLQSSYLRDEQYDKAMQAGERLLEIDNNDLNAATLNKRAAEGKKDPVLVKKWSDRVTAIEKRPAAPAEPAKPAPKEARPTSPS